MKVCTCIVQGREGHGVSFIPKERARRELVKYYYIIFKVHAPILWSLKVYLVLIGKHKRQIT